MSPQNQIREALKRVIVLDAEHNVFDHQTKLSLRRVWLSLLQQIKEQKDAKHRGTTHERDFFARYE